MIDITKLRRSVGVRYGIPLLKGLIDLDPIDKMLPLLNSMQSNRGGIKVADLLPLLMWVELNRQMYFQELPFDIVEERDADYAFVCREDLPVKKRLESMVVCVDTLDSDRPHSASEAFTALANHLNYLLVTAGVTQRKLDNYAKRM